MKSTRKIVSLVLAAVLLLSVFVITPISASAAVTTQKSVGAQQKAMYIMENLNISQGMYGSYSHQGSKAIDMCGKDSGKDPAYAPYDGKVVYVSTSAAYIIFQSLNPVEYADGTVDYMTIMVIHDDNVGRFSVGQTFSQGAHFFNEGCSGNATGNHIHLECAKGTYAGQSKNSSGVWCLNNQINPYDALYLSNTTNVINGYGYNWRRTSVVKDTEPPVIKGGYISEVTDSGFRVCFEATDNIGITSARVATWATGDMSDLIWHNCMYNGSGTYFVDLKRTDYAPGATYYISHAYVYDAAGNQASKEFTKSYSDSYSVVNSIYFSQITRETFRICCEVNDTSNIESVRVATWATGDQSDIKWTGCYFNGNTTYFAELNRNDYKNGVTYYICHVYIKFKSGKEQSFEKALKYDDTPPVISDLQINDVSEDGFWISCKVEDASSINSVKFPTWLASDPNQTDIKWHEANILDGDASCYIPMSEHNNKVDTYYIHVYAYDSFDNLATARITIDMKAEIEKQQNATTEPVTDMPTEPTETESPTNSTTETSSSEGQPTQPTETQPGTDEPTEPTQPSETEPITNNPTEPTASESQPTEPIETQPVTDDSTQPTVTQPIETQPTKTDLSKWNVSGIINKTYTGRVIKQDNIIVSKDGEYADFSVKYKNNLNVGTATVTITGTGDYTGTITTTFKITKANNPIKVTAKKTVTANSKKKTTIKKAITVKKAQGKVTYKTNNKKVKVKNGKLIVAKGIKKGKTIKVKVTITAKGNSNYKMKKIVKTIKLKVK